MDTFWVGVALVIFLAILVKFGVPGMIVKGLDARGERVAQELAEARRLRQEAEKLLAEYDSKRKAAEAEAAEIVSSANDEAKRLAAEAEAKLADFVARRTKAAEEKIAQAESQAEAEVR
ncbi:ATP F0F1 synthase subunit B, partial [uncultured Bosea sp.]